MQHSWKLTISAPWAAARLREVRDPAEVVVLVGVAGLELRSGNADVAHGFGLPLYCERELLDKSYRELYLAHSVCRPKQAAHGVRRIR